jgi:tRNA CCA-adding enzyme
MKKVVSVKGILDSRVEKIKPSKEVLNRVNGIYVEFKKELEGRIRKKGIEAEVFLGGSLAKGSLVKKDVYDVDVFVRFDKKYGDEGVSGLLGKVLGRGFKKVHGSRNYYQKMVDGVLIEVIPTIKINRPEEAENVTDLSYSHVRYLVKKLKGNVGLRDDILLAKDLAHAQGVYGAESYINGFSGYALELLVVHYGGLVKLMKAFAKFDFKKRKLVIDSAKSYGSEGEIMAVVNPSKKVGPVIMIDPTYKERNVVSGLSLDSLLRFQKVCRKFLANPSLKYFEMVKVGSSFKGKDDYVIVVKTDRQAGNIAGTKSKKFFGFVLSRLGKEFVVRKSGFEYDDIRNESRFYFRLSRKEDDLVKGPLVSDGKNAGRFRKVNESRGVKSLGKVTGVRGSGKVFEKDGYLYVKVKHSLTFDEWFSRFLKVDKKVIGEMGVIEVEKG